MDIEEIKRKKRCLQEKDKKVLEEANAKINETERVSNVLLNTKSIIEDIDKEFEKVTKLDKADIVFLMFAAMIQSLRWVIMPGLSLPRIDELEPEIPKEERLISNEKNHSGGVYDGEKSGSEYEHSELKKYRDEHAEKEAKSKEEFYNKENRYRSWIEILTQPVPYDAMNAKDKDLIPNIANLNKKNINGKYSNIYGKNHHVATLGHDPILGWVFGTANIMTSTISYADLQNYRVLRGHSVRATQEFQATNELLFSDQIIDYAQMCSIIKIIQETIYSTMEDKKRITAAVVRQAIHLASDKHCIEGLPIPLLSSINPQKAQELIEKGWNSIEFNRLLKSDLRQIGISAATSILINLILEAIYIFCIEHKSSDSMDIKRVRFNKIISIADAISASSNIIYCGITKNCSKLDIGGIGVTILELLHSEKFIYNVKKEYIREHYKNTILGEK